MYGVKYFFLLISYNMFLLFIEQEKIISSIYENERKILMLLFYSPYTCFFSSVSPLKDAYKRTYKQFTDNGVEKSKITPLYFPYNRLNEQK